MAWRLGMVPAGTRVEHQDGALVVNGVPFTDREGFVAVPIDGDLPDGDPREGALQARVVIRRETGGVMALFVEQVRFRGVQYPSFHEFALRRGTGWIRYVPERVKRCFDTHAASYPPRRASGERRISETGLASRADRSR